MLYACICECVRYIKEQQFLSLVFTINYWRSKHWSRLICTLTVRLDSLVAWSRPPRKVHNLETLVLCPSESNIIVLFLSTHGIQLSLFSSYQDHAESSSDRRRRFVRMRIRRIQWRAGGSLVLLTSTSVVTSLLGTHGKCNVSLPAQPALENRHQNTISPALALCAWGHFRRV